MSSSTSSLDPSIWKACAGAGAGKLHTVGSSVYYFPQGHVEQSSTPIDFNSISITKLYSLCLVSEVFHQANPDSDEVFSRLRLRPISASSIIPPPPAPETGGGGVVSFAKVLTPSDANNGGGFSVPRFCADSIFPRLDYNADPPVQQLILSDVHRNNWEFRHIYRGTPRRHLLTTGWSKFVNSKKLIAGDSVIFIKNGDGKLFVGIRRIGRSCANPGFLKLDDKMSNVGSKDGFSRNVKGRVPADSIIEAIRLMEIGQEFEVVYYPRAGPEFVVEQEVVDKSTRLYWMEGMRIKMSVETEDSSRMTWFQGVVTRNNVKDSGPWLQSPWRMLQVKWDEPEDLPNVIAVSPWQVELVPPSHHMQASFPPMKKLKAPGFELSSDGHGSVMFPQSLTDNMKMENLTTFPTFPAGMQGARHDFRVPSLSNFLHGNTYQIFSDNFYGNNMPEELNTIQTDAASPPNQESTHKLDLDLVGGVAAGTLPRKVSKGSFQLFGKIIRTNESDDGSVGGGYAASEGVRSLEISLSFPHNPLFDGVDVQHQRVSAAEA